MAYRKPGTYARFVRTVSPVVNAGGSRILGLVGTGVNYFTIENEAVLKSTSRPYDELANHNVFEILSVSSKPIYDGLITDDNIIYNPSTSSQRGYTVNDNIINWDYLIDPTVTIDGKTCPKFYENNVFASIDDSALYPVVDGNWIIEVSYINEDDDVNDPKLGCYRIINADTAEIIGEYVVSDTQPARNEDGTYPIPGVMLIVKNTYIRTNPFIKTLAVNVGDYITITTVAAKTETEAKAYKQNISIDTPYNLTWDGDPVSTRSDDFKMGQDIFNSFYFKWKDITGSANRYYLYAKTSMFDGYNQDDPDKSVYTSNLSDAYKVSIEAQTECTVSSDDLKKISGYNDDVVKTFGFTVKDATTNAQYEAQEAGQTGEGEKVRLCQAISITIDDYNKDEYQYFYQLIDSDGNVAGSENILLKKNTTKITIPIEITAGVPKYKDDVASVQVGVYKSKANYYYTKDLQQNDNNATGEDLEEFSPTETGAIIPYDLYTADVIDLKDLTKAASSTTTPFKSVKASASTNKLTGEQQTQWKNIRQQSSENSNKNEEIAIKDLPFNSSKYGLFTNFYFMLVALDENNSPVDFVYYVPDQITNTIGGTGAHTDDPDNTFGVVGLTNSPFSITGLGATATATNPKDKSDGISTTNLYNAVSNVRVISDDTLFQHNAIYRLTIVSNESGATKLRITRYVNGQLDKTWLEYAGIENRNGTNAETFYNDPPTPDVDPDFDFKSEFPAGDDDGWATTKLETNLLVDLDSEIFDIIPGVAFDFDLDEIPNMAYGDSILIISTPKVTSDDVPNEGETYYVSYKYRKADVDYDPIYFDDYDDIVATYGNYDVSASSAVMNSISLAAEIAFNNGVSQIVCCQARNNSDYEMQAAIDRMRKETAGAPNVSTIIPLTTSDAVGAYLQKHVDLMSSYQYGKERMGYLGAKIGQKINKIATKNDRTLGMTTVADGYDDERIVYVVPGAIRRQVRDLRTGRYNLRTLPGVYAAVAVASVGLSQDPAEPLTNKNISGFVDLVDLFSESEKNTLAANGCCVLEMRGQNIRIRHGITTNNNEVNSQEITLIQIKDYVIDGCRRVTADTYIGRKLTATLIADIKYTMESLLNGYVSEGVIISYSSLKVKRNSDEPRQVDVSFEIEAVYPLNWISIEFGFSAVQ